jgi:hypothetical protein
MMKLSASDLQEIVNLFDKIKNVPAEIKNLTVAGHDIWVERNDDGEYVLRGADQKEVVRQAETSPRR